MIKFVIEVSKAHKEALLSDVELVLNAREVISLSANIVLGIDRIKDLEPKRTGTCHEWQTIS